MTRFLHMKQTTTQYHAYCVVVCFLNLFCDCNGYKILVISSMPGTSHTILGHGLVRHITKAGSGNIVNVQKIMDKEHDVYDLGFIFKFMNGIHVMTLENENMQRVLSDPNENFDLIIAEWVFSETSAIFDCPFIWFSTVEPHWIILQIIDEISNPSYNPDVLSSNMPPFTFLQRMQELLYQIRYSLYQYFSFNPAENMYYDKIIAPVVRRRGKRVPSFEELRHNVSLVLGNSHVSLGLPTRLPQNYKPIGGYHIETNTKPLPKDLQKIMINAQYGVIYFSLGSNLKSIELPTVIKTGLLKIFGELKQTIIWKFEKDLADRPKNVHIIRWAPQQTHSKCVLFITHGGCLSSTETVHFGVPIIGIPVYGDQFNNVDRAVNKGYAIRVDLSYTMVDDLKEAITEVLTVPKYRVKVKELSLVYHDRPVSPGDEVAHWVQHVIRTKGAPHLRSQALLLPWYQKMYLDWAALLFVILAVFKLFTKTLLVTLRHDKRDDKKKTN